mmetsp:Transcript_4636/g.17433  ORF Transcript_4636/g.17433 Transcript_4636/m.17433 type:complete len:328 (+) Transcript_4636:1003-1986(+)
MDQLFEVVSQLALVKLRVVGLRAIAVQGSNQQAYVSYATAFLQHPIPPLLCSVRSPLAQQKGRHLQVAPSRRNFSIRFAPPHLAIKTASLECLLGRALALQEVGKCGGRVSVGVLGRREARPLSGLLTRKHTLADLRVHARLARVPATRLGAGAGAKRRRPIVLLADIEPTIAWQVPSNSCEVLKLLTIAPERPTTTNTDGAATLRNCLALFQSTCAKLLDVGLVQASHRARQDLLVRAVEDPLGIHPKSEIAKSEPISELADVSAFREPQHAHVVEGRRAGPLLLQREDLLPKQLGASQLLEAGQLGRRGGHQVDELLLALQSGLD